MTRQYINRALTAIALSFGLLAASLGSAHAAGHKAAQRPLPSPKALDLRVSDLPAGAGQTLSEVETNAEAALQEGTPLAVLRAQGRTTSYLAAFEYGTAQGLVDVYATVSLYRTAQGAHLAYVARYAKLAEMGPRSLGRLGSESVAYVLGSESVAYVLGDGMPEYAYLRRGRAVLDMVISGAAGSFSGRDLAHNAGIVDARLRRAGA